MGIRPCIGNSKHGVSIPLPGAIDRDTPKSGSQTTGAFLFGSCPILLVLFQNAANYNLALQQMQEAIDNTTTRRRTNKNT